MPLQPDQLAVLPPCADALEFIQQTKDYVIINKPAGLLSVPGRNPANHDCVLERLQGRYPNASMVHRLDFDTSGIMVVALNKEAHRTIARQFQERQTRKTYTGVAAGRLAETEGSIDLPIAPDKDRRPRSKIDAAGKASLTHFTLLSYDALADTSRLLLHPVTGRSHQLRLHLAALGHPLLGCAFYAPLARQAQAPRLLLHATSLGFSAPDGQWVEYTCRCPF